MASLRRSKTFTPDGQTAKFLYTILKQLDLKTVDWAEVAEGLGITNGHAARMRYSRFKQHIEGIPTQPRAPRAKKPPNQDGTTKGKRKRDISEEAATGEIIKPDEERDVKRIKSEPFPEHSSGHLIPRQESIWTDKSVPRIKFEPGTEEMPMPAFIDQALLQTPSTTQFSPPVNPTQARTGAAANMSPSVHMAGPPPPPPHPTVSMANLHLSVDNTTGMHYAYPPFSPNHFPHQGYHPQHYYSPYAMQEMMYRQPPIPIKPEPGLDEYTRPI